MVKEKSYRCDFVCLFVLFRLWRLIRVWVKMTSYHDVIDWLSHSSKTETFPHYRNVVAFFIISTRVNWTLACSVRSIIGLYLTITCWSCVHVLIVKIVVKQHGQDVDCISNVPCLVYLKKIVVLIGNKVSHIHVVVVKPNKQMRRGVEYFFYFQGQRLFGWGHHHWMDGDDWKPQM